MPIPMPMPIPIGAMGLMPNPNGDRNGVDREFWVREEAPPVAAEDLPFRLWPLRDPVKSWKNDDDMRNDDNSIQNVILHNKSD